MVDNNHHKIRWYSMLGKTRHRQLRSNLKAAKYYSSLLGTSLSTQMVSVMLLQPPPPPITAANTPSNSSVCLQLTLSNNVHTLLHVRAGWLIIDLLYRHEQERRSNWLERCSMKNVVSHGEQRRSGTLNTLHSFSTRIQWSTEFRLF